MDRVEGLMTPVSAPVSCAGFLRWEIQGDFAGGPLERDDQQMIAWAWREPS